MTGPNFDDMVSERLYNAKVFFSMRFLFVILIIALVLPVQAQSYSPQQIKLAEQLHSLSKNAPPELAYIQTSKDIYETGEDLWFKVYLLDAQYLNPSELSKTLYLQLIKEDTKKVVWQEKYEIQDGFSNGRVYLASNLPEGDYILEAFTPNSFFNDTTEFKAVRRIKIVTDITSQKSDSVKSGKSIINKQGLVKSNSIQFNTFPEGGDLVSGILSKLAFKAVNHQGEPVDIEGTLFEDSTPLLEIKSIHAGMGSFDFIPDDGKKYIIKLTHPAIDSSFLLPGISREGMTMKLIERNKESLSFKLSQSAGLEENDFYLRVQCRGVVYGMTTGKLKKELIVKIPLALLPQGIAEITLFNSSLIPVEERLVYVNQERKLNITTELSQSIYPTRGKAILKITARDENEVPVMANLGVSIFDKVYQNSHDSINILCHTLLSTQLKGRIYNPSYYFNNSGESRYEALDLLMLTQGWRKYVWNEQNLNKLIKNPKQIIFDGIQGMIYYPARKKKIPKDQAFVMAFCPNKDSLNVIIPADSAGQFWVSPDLLSRWREDYAYLKPFGRFENQLPKKNYDPLALPEFSLHVSLSDPFETINHLMKVNEIIYPPATCQKEKEDTSGLYSIKSGVVRIKEVTIKGQRSKIVRGKFLGALDSIAYNADDYVCRYGVLNCPNHGPTDQGTTKPIQGKQYAVIYNNLTYNPRVRIITYWRPKYSEDELLKVNNLSRVKAYYGNREFYKPNYDQDKGEEIIPDFRNILLWEPSVITDENGEATLTFFCSDINTDFVGRIEGVGGDGLLGAGYFNFKVRKLNITP